MDEHGLHLRLTEDAAGWLSAEVIATLPHRPRRLHFTATMPAGLGGVGVVGGIFLYRSDRCEIDFELGRWGNPLAPAAQYAVAPANRPELLHRFDLDPTAVARHTLRWWGRSLTWTTRVEGVVVARWRIRGDSVPRFSSHRLHINLWLRPGEAPQQSEPVELVIYDLSVWRF